jgi:hypothetical protein
MNTNGNPEGAVKIISQILTLLPNEVNQLDKTLKVKDILIELHLNLAEGYTNLGQPAAAQSTLEKVFNSQVYLLSITWSHELFKRLANHLWVLLGKHEKTSRKRIGISHLHHHLISLTLPPQTSFLIRIALPPLSIWNLKVISSTLPP